jgi:riboflavin synthase
MFTGLIRETASVIDFSNNYLTVKSSYEPQIGDSIAINGTCLTVVRKTPDTFTVELSPETRKTIATENLKGAIHMEPAMQLSDRLEGHIVQGHIDTIGEITKIEKLSNATDFYIKIPREYIRYVIPKGSIAVDGISLTVNDVYEESFRLTIIPHTLENTLFSSYTPGRRVNIETDMFARYLYHMFSGENGVGKEKNVGWNTIDAIMAGY